MGQAIDLPQRPVSYPNRPLPTPMRTRIRPRPLTDRHPGPRTHAPQPPPPGPPHPDSLPPGPRPRRGRHPSPPASGRPPIPSPSLRALCTCPRSASTSRSATSAASLAHDWVHTHARLSPDTCEPADDNDCITVVPKRFRRARGCPYSGRTALLPGAPLTAPSAAGVPPRTGRSRGLQAERPRAQHSG